MNHKKEMAIFLPLLFFLSLYIYVERLFTPIGTFVFSFSSALFLVLSILFFTKDYVFRAWFKFSKFYLPISTILVLITPDSSGNIMDFDNELTALWLAGIFLISSLGIIIYKSFKKE